MRFIGKIILSVTIIFLFALPKGGIKIGGIPLTWGYLLVFLVLAILLLKKLLIRNKPSINRNMLFIIMLAFPFMIYSFVTLIFKEIESMGFAFSFILSIIIFPVAFLILVQEPTFRKNYYHNIFVKLFRISLRFVVVFGIVCFFLKLYNGTSIEIPYLTINAGDEGEMDGKYNGRGGIFKLTSTFNNGNIYGICLLILFPLYLKLENRKLYIVLYIISLILTLSRTVWIGLVLYLLLYIFFNLRRAKLSLLLIVIIGVAIIIGLPFLVDYIGLSFTIFDKALGGRDGQLKALNDVTLIGHSKFEGVSEIVYLSILNTFGIVGLLLFVLYISAPFFVALKSRKFGPPPPPE